MHLAAGLHVGGVLLQAVHVHAVGRRAPVLFGQHDLVLVGGRGQPRQSPPELAAQLLLPHLQAADECSGTMSLLARQVCVDQEAGSAEMGRLAVMQLNGVTSCTFSARRFSAAVAASGSLRPS